MRLENEFNLQKIEELLNQSRDKQATNSINVSINTWYFIAILEFVLFYSARRAEH